MNVHLQTKSEVRPAEIARRAFWSFRHPLNQAFRIARDTSCFSLMQLIEFAEELPAEILADYAEGSL